MKVQQNGERKKGCVYIVIFVIIMILTGCSFYESRRSNVLEDVVQPAMNINLVKTPSWYFFNEDRLYVYEYASGKDFLYSLNLQGKDRKSVAVSDELRFADFMMVHDGEAYFYSGYKRGVKKVNLSTGEITMLVEDEYYYLMADTLQEGRVLVNYTNNYVDKSHTKLAILNLKSGELCDENKVNFAGFHGYFWDAGEDKVYYLCSEVGQNMVYEDDKVIYTYEANNYLGETDGNCSDLVFVQGGYIYVVIGNKVVKMDKSDYSVQEEKTIDGTYSLVSGVRPGGATVLGVEEGPAVISLYPLFTTGVRGANDSLYRFDVDALSFEKVIDGEFPGGFVQCYGDSYVFQTETKTTIWNSVTGTYRVYDSAEHTVEGDYIYLMTYTGDFYHQREDNLAFEIKKLELEME